MLERVLFAKTESLMNDSLSAGVPSLRLDKNDTALKLCGQTIGEFRICPDARMRAVDHYNFKPTVPSVTGQRVGSERR